MDDKIELWSSRIGKFCIIDYESSDGLRPAKGELINVIDDMLILRNIITGEIMEISVCNIKNSKIREIEGDNNVTHK